MKFNINNITKSLSKTHLQKSITRIEIDALKRNLNSFFSKVNANQNASEEHYKNILIEFLKETYYKNTNEVNTKDRIDLAVYNGKTASDSVGVICEVKKPANISEMISLNKPNAKALHELVLYFLRERNNKNLEIKNLIATNINEWFIFDANEFDKLFYQEKKFLKLFENWNNGNFSDERTEVFYKEVAKPYIDEHITEINCTYFKITDFEEYARNNDDTDDLNLIELYKILSPIHLLKEKVANDSNSLNSAFYTELLHIIGLEEVKDGGKLIIRRKEKDRQAGSLIENTINILITEDSLRRVSDKTAFGATKDEQLFNIALELSLTWINRILFLKLLEGSLIAYNKGNKDYRFLNPSMIPDFDELYKLFHQVLARQIQDRTGNIKIKYAKVPYLNSSLFEISDLEDQTVKINSLDNSEQIDLYSKTVLIEEKQKTNKLEPVEYLLKFLDAFDFASEGRKKIAEENKTIINASVLGKVFEKINGYKDGSIFTPGFITMYMSRQALRLAAVQKFNDYFTENEYPTAEKFEDLYNKIARIDINKSNEIINSMRICDPAVGSGHFLVSSLNELIAIKSELGILADKNGKVLKDYEITIENDELIITDEDGIFNYNFQNKESQRVQEAIFKEKQTLIENCLFGVDINPNSVKICRLRLWIELLKSSYYKPETLSQQEPELETLPNIDINIKCGNSLMSRFALDADLSKALKSIKYDINAYRGFVQSYKNEKNRDVKRGIQEIIDAIKGDFRTEIGKYDPKQLRLTKLSTELYELNQSSLFELSEKEKKEKQKKKDALEKEITKLSTEIEEIKNNNIYRNAFEWRFEFPEVLNDNGDFVGFDVVIGNPPYIQLQSMGSIIDSYSSFETFNRSGDIYALFFEKGFQILKKDNLLIYITSNRFCFTNYGVELRKYLSNKNIIQFINFNDVNVFENINVGSLISIISKQEISNNPIKTLEFKKDYLTKYIDEIIIEKSKLQNKEFFNENQWNFDENEIQKIKQKIERKGIPFNKWEDISINRGITTGLNEIFIINENLKSKFVLEDESSNDILIPVLKGANIKRFQVIKPKNYIIYTYTGINIEKYKPIYKYLLEHKKSLSEVYEAKNNQKKWYELRKCSYYSNFKEKKLIWTRLSNTNAFAISTEGEFSVDSTSFAVTKDTEYLCSILNSKAVLFYFKLGSVIWGKDGIKWFGNYFDSIPIPEISKEAQQPFIDLVEIILAKKKLGEDTTSEEKAIDQLVYQLYELTEEEIRIVEGE